MKTTEKQVRVFVAKQILEFPLLPILFAVGWDHGINSGHEDYPSKLMDHFRTKAFKSFSCYLHTPLFFRRGSMLQRDDSFLEMGALNTTSSEATLLIFVEHVTWTRRKSAKHKVLRFWLNLLPQLALAWSVSQAQDLLKLLEPVLKFETISLLSKMYLYYP